MDYIFLAGLVGSILLVIGAAWPEPKKKMHPVKSVKNWFFIIGGLLLLNYAMLGYLKAGPIFFVFLQILVLISDILMMLDTDDRIDTAVISITGAGLVIWSLFMFSGYGTVIFIFGLMAVGLGHAFEMGSLRRSIALTAGSMLIALFSYLEANWIFFWLNVFFALFSGYYLIKGLSAHSGRPNRKTGKKRK